MRGVLSTGTRPQLVTGEAVTANYFAVLGVHPPLGRAFRDDEGAAPGGAPVAVVSHGLWQRQLGGRPEVVGATVKLSGLDYTVIGVAPAEFPGTVPGIPTDFWVPVTMIDRLQFTGVQWTGDDDPAATRLEQRSHAVAVRQGPARARPERRAGAGPDRGAVRAPGHGLSQDQREGEGQRRAGRRTSGSIRCSTATCGPPAR